MPLQYRQMRSSSKKKKQNERIELSHTQGVSSPESVFISPRPERLQDKLTSIIARRISKLHAIQKIRVIKNIMHNLYGRHNPINYRSQFNFQQGWQNSNKETTFQQKYSLLKTNNYFYITLHFTLYLLYGFAAWFFSVYRLYDIDTPFYYIVALIMVVKIVDGILKQILMFQTFTQYKDGHTFLTVKDYIKFHWVSLISLVYLVAIILQHKVIGAQKNHSLFVMDLFFIWSSYQRFKQLYQAIKFRGLSSKYRNQIQILQLIGGCILLVHVFAVILYLISFINSDLNWTLDIQYFKENWISKYIYSLYFSSTTALTVGYGDITPKNLFQIMTVFFVEIVGIINIGYIVNQIGRILSIINENKEVLYKNISETEKMTKNYRLPDYLATKMRTYILNNQVANNQLNIQEEDSLMKKLNDQIREDINSHNQLRLIKTSVFFLCQWSKKFQQKIATKLVRCIYSPQETLNQVFGKQKLYILAKGKVQIQACFSTNQKPIKKALNIIEYNPKKEVQFNVYGYTALISGLQVKLKAIVKDYSICYQITKQDILSTIVEDQTDFEYFHEIKERIQISRFKQIWQAPIINNTRQHYIPNPYYIIKKDKKRQIISNNRAVFVRRYIKYKCFIQQNQLIAENDKESVSSDQHIQDTDKQLTNTGNNPEPVDLNSVLTDQQRRMKYNAIQNGLQSQYIVTGRKYRHKPQKILIMDTADLQKQQKVKIINNFEYYCNFKSYLPKFNFSKVIQKYNKKYKIRQELLSKSSSKFDSRLGQILNEDIMLKLLNFKTIRQLA